MLSPLPLAQWVLRVWAVSALTGAHLCAQESTPPRPNLVWISVEDMSPWIGCYGDDTVPTPNIDRLAAEGVNFTHG